MNPLQLRLAALRRRLRLVITFRGGCWLLALILAAAALAGLLDWCVPLPSLVRAILLTIALSGSITIGYRFLLRPLSARADDLTLALRVEACYPALNDCLASTVQFLESDATGSPRLRQEAVRRALHKAQRCNFHRAIDARGLYPAGLSLAFAAALAIPLVFLDPSLAGTALARLADPFGRHEWTKLEIAAPSRLARGDPFEVRASLHGVIPEKAVVTFWLDGLSTSEQACSINRDEDLNRGTFVARLDPGQVQRNFRFQVRAYDATSGPHEVRVLPPPVLVPLAGRPSPQLRLHYPAYTDLPPHDLPDGSGNIEAVAGTRISLRAATDRPVARVWIAYRPEQHQVDVAGFLGPIGAPHAVSLAPDGRVLAVEFLPWISGTYALRFEDETGLGNSRLLDVRLWSDPPPMAHLDRPSASLDGLAVLPGAEITLQITAEDAQYALRDLYLEYRCQAFSRESQTSADSRSQKSAVREKDIPRQLPLHDHKALEHTIPILLASLSGGPLQLLSTQHSALSTSFKLRPQRLQVVERLSLKQMKHRDGAELREGDIVILQACADDFDNVAVDKQPGRSHEIELRIVGPETLETLLNQAQAQVQQELLRLREQQREALKKVADAEKQWRHTTRLRPEDLDSLLQAEQLQQQIRARVGTKQEGLRAEAARILQTLRDNHLPRSGTHDRMETVAAELDRLARQELEQIEPLLTTARKANELAAVPPKPEKTVQSPLGEARQHQEEVEKTLAELLARLEPWSTTREVKGEAKAILQKQRTLNYQTEKLGKAVPRGREPDVLPPSQRTELEKAGDEQGRLADHAGQLLNKMDRVAQEKARLAQEKETQAPETAEALRQESETLQKAAKHGRGADNLDQQMKQAGTDIRQNRLGDAAKAQQTAARTLAQVIRELDERREAELDLLVKKLREAERQMEQLGAGQEELQKKVREAGRLTDPKERAEALQRLAREQEKLRQQAEELVRRLSRLRAERAGQALGRAAGQMEDAGQQMDLDKGEAAEDRQDEALDRLAEARRELQRARAEVEEELAREQLAKVADQIRRLKERQEASQAEATRIHRDLLQKKDWERGLLASLRDLARGQEGLGQEATALAGGKLSDAPVFARVLGKSADAMKQAAARIQERFQKAKDSPEPDLDLAAENAADQETQKLQGDALHRLDQLLEALKPEAGGSRRASQPDGGQPTGGSGNGDGIPHLAQLKALRALQREVNQRTEEFAKRHPERAKLTDKEKVDLDALRRDQEEVAELLQELTKAAASEGGSK